MKACGSSDESMSVTEYTSRRNCMELSLFANVYLKMKNWKRFFIQMDSSTMFT